MAVPSFAVPGDKLTATITHRAGPGTHAYSSNLFASIAGPVGTSKFSLSIPSSQQATSASLAAATPSVGDVVLGRITRTAPRQATLDILALGSSGFQVLREPFQALVRQQDIRATEIDKVRVVESFRVGDIVRAVVISIGDERNYYVSTAKNEYGVVLAKSEADNQMVPVSWREMRDLNTGRNESRKVAKVV